MPVRSLNSSVLKWPDRQTIDKSVRDWVSTLVSNRSDILRVGYFGSYAKNEWGVGSDLDIIVIITQSNKPFWQRSLEFDLTNLPLPSEILIYTRDEWEEMRKERRSFYQTVEQEAVWIYEKNGELS